MISNLKAYSCFCFIALIILCLAGCGYGFENSSNIEWRPSETDEAKLNTNPNVIMKTEHASYLPGVKSLNIIISNNTGNTLDYGAAYMLERREDGKWYSANMDDIAWIMIAYILSPGETQTHEIDFTVLKGKIANGEYRIIKSIGGGLYSAEFSVAAAG